MAYTGKVALVTGAGSGMGQLAARTFAQTGAAIAALDVNQTGLAETAKGYDNLHPFKADVTDYDWLKAVIEEIELRLGPIDRVYHAAGIMPLGKILDMDVKVIHKLMDINYGGTVNITKLTLPQMVERGKGDFITFGSMVGWIPALLTGAYCASKFAVNAFTEILYHENRDSGVRFACVCPPVVNTPLLDQGRDTAWPKLLEKNPAIEPEAVINEVEKALDKGEFWVFPGKGTKIGWRMRRWFPRMIWNYNHKVEGW